MNFVICGLLTCHSIEYHGPPLDRKHKDGRIAPMAKITKQPWVWLVGVFAIMIVVGIATA